jgi:hypothetical protein
MIIEEISAFVATVLAVSLATERLVVIAKTAAPVWLADEKKTDAAEVDLLGDRWRRLRVHLLAFLTAWLIAASLAEFDFMGRVELGSASGASMHVLVLALLSMGGSAFWASIVGYASAAKDIRMQARASEALSFQAKAKEQGKVPADSGIAAVARGASSTATNMDVVLRKVMTLDQPKFGAGASRVAGNG